MTNEIDYTAKDYDGFRASMLNTALARVPEWTVREESDLGLVLVEVFAHVADILSFYGDRVVNESYLATATERQSVVDIARMLSYEAGGSVGSTVTLTFTVDTSGGDVTIPAGTRVATPSLSDLSDTPVVFETDDEVVATSPATSIAAEATQGRTITSEELGTTDGRADQTLQLLLTPVIEGSVSIFVDEGTGALEWSEFAHLIDATDVQPAFQLQRSANGYVSVRFGDGVNGRIPANGSTVTATYRIDGGLVGNVGPQTITTVQDAVVGVTGVSNSAAAAGGTDAESTEDIRRNAASTARAALRAVTLQDFRDLALAQVGVGRANSAASFSSSVLVYIAPPGGGQPTAARITAVTTALDTYKMVGTTVTVLGPTYVAVNAEVDVEVDPRYGQSVVELAVTNALTALLQYANTDFAQRVSVASVYRAINTIEGVLYATVTKLVRNDDGDQNQVIDIVTDPEEIPQAGTLTVTATGGIA